MRIMQRQVVVAILSAAIASIPLTSTFATNAAARYTLHLSDLPKGYVLVHSTPVSAQAASGQTVSAAALLSHGYVAGYLTSFGRSKPPGLMMASSGAYVFRTAAGARWAYGALTGELGREGFKAITRLRLDDASRGYWRAEQQGKVRYTSELTIVRNGTVFALVDLRGPARVVRLSAAMGLARIIAARMKS
jgi:hypothetical protein